MGKHAAPELEQPELDPGELEYEYRYPELPFWQRALGSGFIAFFAILGIWRIVLEFIVR